MMRSHVSSLVGCALSFAASACQFDSSPLAHAAACGLPSGVPCTTMNAAASSDASMAVDFGPAPGHVQTSPAMQPNAPPAPSQLDAGSKPPPAAQDAGVRTPPPHAAMDAARPTDAGTTPPPVDAAPTDADVPPTTRRGAAFAPCTAHGECASGLCTVDPSTTGSGSALGYCTSACGMNWQNGGNGWTGTGGSASDPIACPQPSSGSVSASCQFPGLCLLDACDAAKTCPDGLNCVQTQTPAPSQSGQVVWVSTCQVKGAP